MIRLLLADDHTVVRESLVAALIASGECIVVAEAGDGITAIELALALRPDVAIIDISMPRLSGIEVVRRLTAELPRTRVLVLTMHEEEEYVLHVVRAGAAGYLLKHAATSELLNAVRTLAAGGVHFGPYAAKVLADQVQQPQRTHDDPYGALTSREREVLHLVVDGLTTKEIARRLDISVKTAENHRGRILDKLDVRNSAELVRYAMRKRLVE
jgi:two-component system response regulator NreC